MNQASATADFRLADHGTVMLFTPLTDAAHCWADENLPADTAVFAGSLAIESRCMSAILDAVKCAGLVIAS